MAKTMAVPDLNALGDFALAAVRNARRLLDDADLLLRRGRWPSAYSLAVLAFAEAGKAWMCIIGMMVPDDVRPEWLYGDLITTHVDKLMAAHVMAHMLASATGGRDMITDLADVGENLEELAREHNHAKQRGLYADLLDDTVREPDGGGGHVAARHHPDYRGSLASRGCVSAGQTLRSASRSSWPRHRQDACQ